MERALVRRRSPLRALALLARRVMLRTGRTRLKNLWRLAHGAVIRAVAAYLRGGEPDLGVFVGGSFGRGEPVYGVSDVDMIVVIGDSARGRGREKVKSRWARLTRALPPLSDLISDFFVYEQAELLDAVAYPCLTCPPPAPDEKRSRALYLGASPSRDEGGLRERPGLWPTREWRLVVGVDRRPTGVHDEQRRRIAAWLELQFWWRQACRAVAAPGALDVPFLCVKLVAEPARIWLWIAHGEPIFERTAILRRALRVIPEEEPAIRLAIELSRTIARSPDPPLREVVAFLGRMSARIATWLGDEVRGAGATDVCLAWGDADELVLPPRARELVQGRFGGSATLAPLADWRARTVPALLDESLVQLRGDVTDPPTLAAAATFDHSQPLLRFEHLLVLPSADSRRARLRSVQCEATDPVSWALVTGQRVARFPDLQGWSAFDSAERAVAEHAAWLSAPSGTQPAMGSWTRAPDPALPDAGSLAMLLSACRAALLSESLSAGSPALPVTAAAVVDRLARAGHDPGGIAREALGAYRSARQLGTAPPARLVRALDELVRRLPAFSG